MNSAQKIQNLIAGVLLIVGGILLEVFGDEAMPLITLLFGVSMLSNSVKLFVYYFTMARHMVGGQAILYKAVLTLDLATFTLFVINVPKMYIMLYLVGLHLFSGAIDIMGAMDARRLGASSWRVRLFSGIYNVAVSVICLMFLQSTAVMVSVYVTGVVTAGVIRIANSFRRTATVYIS